MQIRQPDVHDLLEQNAEWASRQDPRILKRIAEEKQIPKVCFASVTVSPLR